MLWVYYTISFGFSLFRQFLGIIFHIFELQMYFVWPRITDEGSVPEIRIWSILIIKSYIKWCIHLSRSLFLYSKQNSNMLYVLVGYEIQTSSISTHIKSQVYKPKQKYRGMIENQKSGNKTSSGEIGLNIRTHVKPKMGQDQVSGGVSVLCWHAAPGRDKQTTRCCVTTSLRWP